MNNMNFAALRVYATAAVNDIVSFGKIVNVAAIAAKLKHSHRQLNIAPEDVERLILDIVMVKQPLMEFEGLRIYRAEGSSPRFGLHPRFSEEIRSTFISQLSHLRLQLCAISCRL